MKRPLRLWPHLEMIIDDNSRKESESEVKDNKVLYEAKLISVEGLSKEPVDLSDIDERRYSSLYKLLRVTAWVLRFTNKLRKRNPKTGPLSIDEIQKAKSLWELHIQRKHYYDTIKNLSKGKNDNLQRQLNLKLDENGIIRCYGRFANAEITQGAKSPKILPRKGYFTKLIVEYYHQRVLHSGVIQTLAQTRHEYWIPQGCALTKQIVNGCLICERTEGGPFAMPEMHLYQENVLQNQLHLSLQGWITSDHCT